jgi:hypothetical protein
LTMIAARFTFSPNTTNGDNVMRENDFGIA